MKRTYKLIKRYPNSPELGTIRHYDLEEIEKYPEFWELQEEKRQYKITGLKNKAGNYIVPNVDESASWFSANYEIERAVRLSDNNEFNIGDRVIQPNCPTNRFTITGFTEKRYHPDQLLVLGGNGAIDLNKIEKEKPVMTTYDDVDIYEHDTVYFLRVKDGYDREPNYFYEKYGWSKNGEPTTSDVYLWFSTKKAVKKYIEKYQPKYSLNDIELTLDSFNDNIHFNHLNFNKHMIIDKLKELK